MKTCIVFLFIHLHIVVALKEVGNFALTELGVSEFTSGCGSAQNEISTLFWAVRGTLVWEDQLFQSTQTTYKFVLSYVEAVSSPCIFRII